MTGPWLVSYIALWVLVVILAILVLGLAREVGLLHRRVAAPGAVMTDEGLAIGDAAPDFRALQLPQAQQLDFPARGQREALVIFLSTECRACRDLVPGLSQGWTEWRQNLRVALVCEGDEADVRKFSTETGFPFPIFADPGAAIRANYGNPSTPHAFLIGESGQVRLKGIINSRDDIERLIDGQARLISGRPVIADPIPERIEAFAESAS